MPSMWFSTSMTTLSFSHTCMLGPGIIRFAVRMPRSTPSASTHWQWLHTVLVAFGVHTWQALFACQQKRDRENYYLHPLKVKFTSKSSDLEDTSSRFKWGPIKIENGKNLPKYTLQFQLHSIQIAFEFVRRWEWSKQTKKTTKRLRVGNSIESILDFTASESDRHRTRYIYICDNCLIIHSQVSARPNKAK